LEVAKQLLARGLPWCDGVVFLDENDKQMVLVRATGRVVSADQCGVSLERRFAFYDQIHTTGMDIKHAVNAVAVLTLGKDMVYRDYVQGAYRMRGIGTGQKIRVYVIPEVRELTNRELKGVLIRQHLHDDSFLERIVAWLIVNSLRSEQIQWTMLCIQNIANLYRKNAYKCIVENFSRLKKVAELNEWTIDSFKMCDSALKIFSESIDFSLEASVPDSVPFERKISSMLETNAEFLQPTQHVIGNSIIEIIKEFSVIEGSSNRLETEQEREQEQV